jgi:hypothetical protein
MGAARQDQTSLAIAGDRCQILAETPAPGAIRRAYIADTPPAEGQGLAETGGDDGALRQIGDGAGRRADVAQLAVDLVANDPETMPFGNPADLLDVLGPSHGARGVVRDGEHHYSRPGAAGLCLLHRFFEDVRARDAARLLRDGGPRRPAD